MKHTREICVTTATSPIKSVNMKLFASGKAKLLNNLNRDQEIDIQKARLVGLTNYNPLDSEEENNNQTKFRTVVTFEDKLYEIDFVLGLWVFTNDDILIVHRGSWEPQQADLQRYDLYWFDRDTHWNIYNIEPLFDLESLAEKIKKGESPFQPEQ